MEKIKIAFLAPKNKGGTYYYYKDIVEYLNKEYSSEFEIHFFNSLSSYIKLHFLKFDVVFSIIPFLFKPLSAKKYIYNLHGNYKIERKNKGLGVKLLYLSELNLWFSDSIMLTSYYLSDKLNFRKKYDKKIIIIPNYTNKTLLKNKQLKENSLNFLTITSFKFYEKGKGIINLGNILKKIGDNEFKREINFTIIGNENNDIFFKIKKDFDKIKFTKNVKIIWKGWLDKKDIEREFFKNNTFLYRTELDNFPGVILDAINYNLKVFVNNFESFKFFLDDKYICNNEEEMYYKIMDVSSQTTKRTEKFTINEVIKLIIKAIG